MDFEQAVNAAYEEILRQCPGADDVSPDEDRTAVHAYDAIDLRALARAIVLTLNGASSMTTFEAAYWYERSRLWLQSHGQADLWVTVSVPPAGCAGSMGFVVRVWKGEATVAREIDCSGSTEEARAAHERAMETLVAQLAASSEAA